MQLEAVIPADRILTPANPPVTDSVSTGARQMTDLNGCGIVEANSGNVPLAGMHKTAQHRQDTVHQLHKRVVASLA